MATPSTEFAEFDISGVDPSGNRSGILASSFIKVLGCTSDSALDYGNINIDSKAESDTKVVVFRITDISGNRRIQNMRFWLPAIPNEAGSLGYNMEIQSNWVVDNALTEASGTVPTSLPSSQNLLRCNSAEYPYSTQLNFIHMSGSAAPGYIEDNEVSQFIYLNITADVDTTTGKYGIGGRGNLLYRCTFDYS